MSLESVAQRVAAKVYFHELAAARALGMSAFASYASAFRAMDEAYLSAFEPERPYVWQRPRTIRR